MRGAIKFFGCEKLQMLIQCQQSSSDVSQTAATASTTGNGDSPARIAWP